MRETVLITGATSGIGKCFAKIFVNNGYNLILTSTNLNDLNKEKKLIEEKYKDIKVIVIAKDLSNQGSSKELYEEIKEKNINIDILINNAGFGSFGKHTESDINRLTKLTNVNVVAVMQLAYYFGKDMAKRKKGKILNIASIAAFESGPYMATYFASKAYVLSFSGALSEELKKDNVCVTCLCPGPTATNFESTANLNKSYMFTKLKVTTPLYVARIGYKALMNNKPLVTAGISNKILVFLSRLTPRKLNAKFAKYINLGKIK